VPIYTTYLGFLNKHGGAHKVGMKIGSCFIYYVMRNRGNNEVAPISITLMTLTVLKDWENYRIVYLRELNRLEARKWMEKRAGEAQIGNILLVCYEKDYTNCHRRLLAEEIARRHDVEYKGELSDED